MTRIEVESRTLPERALHDGEPIQQAQMLQSVREKEKESERMQMRMRSRMMNEKVTKDVEDNEDDLPGLDCSGCSCKRTGIRAMKDRKGGKCDRIEKSSAWAGRQCFVKHIPILHVNGSQVQFA